MSELEELPSWAGRSTGEIQPEQVKALQEQAQPAAVVAPIEPRGRKPWKVAMLALFALAALLGMGVLGYLLADQNNSTETATGDNAEAGQLGSEPLNESVGTDEAGNSATETETAAGTDTDAADGEDGATDDADEAITVDVEEGETDEAEATDAEATDEADGETTEEADAGAESTDSGRRAAFRGGKLYLSGDVPSEEVGLFIQEKAAAVVGPDNVINEYTINPETVIDPGESTPLIVEDVVLFEFNSIEVARPFYPILDLGTLLLRQNPQASVTVVTRTDATGSAEINLDVSRRRAQAVIDYWVKAGVNRDQIISDPKGEEGASEDDDEQTAALSRRAEFVITGLLD